MRPYTRVLTAVGAVVVTLAVAACSSGSNGSGSMSGTSGTAQASTSPATDPQHNAADVTFAQQMIVHHEGAIQMADLAPSRSANAQVKEIAAGIKAAQGPEVTEMTGWLQTWGQPVTPTGSMAGMDHSTGSGNMTPGVMGMMSDAQMKELTAATGTTFDRMFLKLMISHHNGAITMAKAERANGSNTQAITLATSILASQTVEVATMTKLLTTL